MGLRVGTIGYKHLFPDLPPSARFRRYAELFDTVELPGTYHRVPDKGQVYRLRKRAPAGFRYSFQAPRYLTYRPGGKERRALRRFLRRHRLLGSARGGVRFQLPQDLDKAAFAEWLSMLAELDLPGEYAFEGTAGLEELALEAGHAAVNLATGPFYYLVDPPRLPDGSGYAYFSRLEDAVRYSTLAQGGTTRNQTR